MGFAARKLGKDAWVGFIDGSGTATLTGDQTIFDKGTEMETADMTAGADTMRAYKGTVKNFGASLEVFYTGTAGTAVAARVEAGDEGTLVWGLLGTASGMPKGGLPVLVTKVDTSAPFDDGIKVTYEFMPQGDFSYNENTATW